MNSEARGERGNRVIAVCPLESRSQIGRTGEPSILRDLAGRLRCVVISSVMTPPGLLVICSQISDDRTGPNPYTNRAIGGRP